MTVTNVLLFMAGFDRRCNTQAHWIGPFDELCAMLLVIYNMIRSVAILKFT
jgi:hypothetical protein